MAAGLGFKDFTTGEVLTAADVDGYLMQGVWVFASATARDAAVTSPQEGNFAFLKDTNVTTYYTGSAWANLDTTGMTNPMTTTGDTIYSSSGSTPARLGIGTAGQVLQVNSGATAPEWATPAAGGGGKVLQVIHSTTSTSTATTSTSFQDTTLTATITPTLATSKILILVSQNSCVRPSGNVDNSLGLQLLRGATSIAVFEKLLGYQGVSGTSLFLSTSTNYLDNPATTSATTYKTQFKSIVSGQSVTVQGDSATSTITLMEIGA
jgi:hypothetical protein